MPDESDDKSDEIFSDEPWRHDSNESQEERPIPRVSSTIALGPGAEFDLVREMVRQWGTSAREIGDDAAIIEPLAGERVVISTDVSVENVHFKREWLSPSEIAYRSVTAALSDLAAMAARPLGLLVALVLPDEWRGRVAELAEGIGDAASSHDAPIIGGDLTRGSSLSLTITVVGSTARPARRDAVRPGDLVYVTGLLGGPSAALRALTEGRQAEPLHLSRFAKPRARIREALALARQGATAMIDISDGFASDVRHLAVASNVELRIDAERIPVLRGCTRSDAMRGGEEYELIVASPHELDVDAFAREFAIPLSEVGRARASEFPRVAATLNGSIVDLGEGHDHFSK